MILVSMFFPLLHSLLTKGKLAPEKPAVSTARKGKEQGNILYGDYIEIIFPYPLLTTGKKDTGVMKLKMCHPQTGIEMLRPSGFAYTQFWVWDLGVRGL